jgi:hypothetical protein
MTKTRRKIDAWLKVHPNQIWKKQLLDHAARAFDPKAGWTARRRRREIEKLHAKIGQAKIENDFSPRGSANERIEPSSQARSRSPRFIRALTMRDARRGALGVYRKLRPANHIELEAMKHVAVSAVGVGLLRGVKPILFRARNGMPALARTPILPEATSVGALSALLRHSRMQELAARLLRGEVAECRSQSRLPSRGQG